jgi:arylsulfatase A-like enzyme
VAVLLAAVGASVVAGPSAGDSPAASTVRAKAKPRPNIVFILTDDMAKSDLAYMPHVKKLLASKGTQFKHALTPFSLCCPDRVTLLTGQYAHNHGVLGNDTSDFPEGGYAGFHTDGNTVATWMHDAGYQTAFVGKYLNGYGTTANPARVPPGWDDWHASRGDNYRWVRMFENGKDHVYDDVYVPNLYQRLATGIIKKRMPHRPPLFMWLSYNTPHNGPPDDPDDCINTHGRDIGSPSPAKRDRDKFAKVGLGKDPSINEADVSDKPAEIRDQPRLSKVVLDCLAEVHRQRLQSLQSVDRGVKAVVHAVKKAGELKKTVFVFTSDNGYMIGQHRVKQGKVLPYDPSIHVPLVIRGPGFPRGAKRSKLVGTQDLAPTFVGLANAHAGRTEDGRSLVRIVNRKKYLADRDIVLEAGPHTIGGPMAFTGLRTKRYTYVEYPTGEKELYDLKRDPYQLQNRAGRSAYASIQRKLARELRDTRDCAGRGCLVETPY